MASTGTHVLLTIGALFAVASGTRALPQAFSGLSETSSPETDFVEAVPVSYALGAAEKEPNVCFSGESATAIIEDQAKIEQRVQSLKEQELSLRTRKIALDQQAEDLKQLQVSLEARWAEMSASANEDIQHLANMYSAMKADQAAGIFNQMDPAFAAGFLRLMPSSQSGLILADMESNKAYIVSVKLASMNADIREAADASR